MEEEEAEEASAEEDQEAAQEAAEVEEEVETSPDKVTPLKHHKLKELNQLPLLQLK